MSEPKQGDRVRDKSGNVWRVEEVSETLFGVSIGCVCTVGVTVKDGARRRMDGDNVEVLG
jgi:recombination DNA repair RAD52 pathway protein